MPLRRLDADFLRFGGCRALTGRNLALFSDSNGLGFARGGPIEFSFFADSSSPRAGRGFTRAFAGIAQVQVRAAADTVALTKGFYGGVARLRLLADKTKKRSNLLLEQVHFAGNGSEVRRG